MLRHMRRLFGVTPKQTAEGLPAFQGRIEKERIELAIDQYVRLDVLCPGCKKPEWSVSGTCFACGYEGSRDGSTKSAKTEGKKSKKTKVETKGDSGKESKHGAVSVSVSTHSSDDANSPECLTLHLLYDRREKLLRSDHSPKREDKLLNRIWKMPGGWIKDAEFAWIKVLLDWIESDATAETDKAGMYDMLKRLVPKKIDATTRDEIDKAIRDCEQKWS